MIISSDRIIIEYHLILSIMIRYHYDRIRSNHHRIRSHFNSLGIMIRYRHRREEHQPESARVCGRAEGQAVSLVIFDEVRD